MSQLTPTTAVPPQPNKGRQHYSINYLYAVLWIYGFYDFTAQNKYAFDSNDECLLHLGGSTPSLNSPATQQGLI